MTKRSRVFIIPLFCIIAFLFLHVPFAQGEYNPEDTQACLEDEKYPTDEDKAACLKKIQRECRGDKSARENGECESIQAVIDTLEGVSNDGAPGSGGSSDGGGFFACSDYNWFGNAICTLVLNLVYGVFYFIPSILAFLMAMVLDFFVFYSIQGSSYSDMAFVTVGWEIMRDIANIVIIGALAYIGISLIFNYGAADSKARLVKVFWTALLINFSFFFATLIIDTGNLLAHVFYNNMNLSSAGGTTTGGGATDGEEFAPFGGDVKSLSLAVVSFSNPQAVFAASAGSLTFMQKLLAIIAGGIFSLLLAYVFGRVTGLFVLRLVGLWIGTAFSVLAFASAVLPGGFFKKYLGGDKFALDFGGWFTNMVRFSLVAPVFLFLMYLIVVFLNSDFSILTGYFDSDTSYVGGIVFAILEVLVPFIVAAGLLLMAVSVTNKMTSNDFIGGVLTGGARKLGGFVSGLPFGGARVAGSALVTAGNVAKVQSKKKFNRSTTGWGKAIGFVGGGASGIVAGSGKKLLRADKYAGKIAGRE